MRGDLRDGAEGGLASLPQQRALGVVGGHTDRADGVRVRRGLDGGALRVDRRLRAVHLDDEDRGGVGRVAGVRERLGSDHDAVVHHLDGRRHDAARDDVGDRCGAVVDGREVEQHRANGGRQRREPDAHGRHDAERPLGAHEHAAQVVARGLGRLRPDPVHRAVGQHDLERRARARSSRRTRGSAARRRSC